MIYWNLDVKVSFYYWKCRQKSYSILGSGIIIIKIQIVVVVVIVIVVVVIIVVVIVVDLKKAANLKKSR